MFPRRSELFDTRKAYELVFLPDGELSDDERLADESEGEPDPDETSASDPDYIPSDDEYEDSASNTQDAQSTVTTSSDQDLQNADNPNAEKDEEDLRVLVEIVNDGDVGLEVVILEDAEPVDLSNIEPIWKNQPSADFGTNHQFKGADFVAPPEELFEPIEYFHKFFGKDLFDHIALQTMMYAHQNGNSSFKTTPQEIEVFLGVHLEMSTCKMPRVRRYWSPRTRYGPVADFMPYMTFMNLQRFLHFNDNTKMKKKNEQGYDPLFKIKPVLEHVRKNCLKVEPEEKSSVDEQMVAFKGRLGIKQYIKNKPTKWGIKIFSIAGSSGIIYDFLVYIGRGTVNNNRGLGIGCEVVLKLAECLPKDKNYKLFFDNWFTSLPLLVELKKKGILGTGTIRQNRMLKCPLPDNKQMKKKERGSYVAYYDIANDLCVVKWLDNRCVIVASSFLKPQPLDHCQRWDKTKKEHITVPRPHLIAEYNLSMGGVDLSDMITALYKQDIRSPRWYMRLFYYAVDLSITNAWFLYRRHAKQKGQKNEYDSLHFRDSIAEALTRAGKPVNAATRKRGRPSADASSEPSSPFTSLQPKKAQQAAPGKSVRSDGYEHFPLRVKKSITWCKKHEQLIARNNIVVYCNRKLFF